MFLTSKRNKRNANPVGDKTVTPVSLQKVQEWLQNFCQLTVTLTLSIQIARAWRIVQYPARFFGCFVFFFQFCSLRLG